MEPLIKMSKKLLHWLIAFFAYWFYSRPSRKIIVIGVTGTKGKSTTSRLVASVLEKGGFKVGLLSTVEFQIGDKHWFNDKKMTMLGRGQIQKMLHDMVMAGCTHVVVETSSEGILQYRHYGLNYDLCVFTNLGSEHAERHGGFENLRNDKGKIFACLKKVCQKKLNGVVVPKTIVANGDDKEVDYFLSFGADRKYIYGFTEKTFKDSESVLAKKVADEDQSFTIGEEKYTLGLVGDFNVYNGLAAAVVGKSFGIKYELIRDALLGVKLVPGRMEFIEAGQSFKVVVDYAHESMSLTALFNSLRKMTSGRIISVVGSDGGGRDVQKRSTMGNIAGKMTDIVIITDVNCYDENPAEIAEMLAEGARAAGKHDKIDLFIELDRKTAIQTAFRIATVGDTVAITAKGTEPYIGIANGKKIPWDDREVAKKLLAELL
ncbi:MAG: UDP-N-acetylmuramyl-tripeptide synthetase [Patescibacteria group bacterium]|jgi:UDP-N-acetylmuramoyl-L-alanyl-D-glutamate--2,6-diaminopimelate ligase